ncbi:DUF11 domain-containing protein [Micromonospora echinofusca]|uniref:DUF11 domain-containing protein n=1 Tax=Micromonospora echinofusca TaxID=47858 RepID=A0ABS3VN96_MICEH|nr:DUF11 domain-containing protein [Micromonospora echinofusca]MBO4206018.1 hypothetical protein [Micromonospora echinofusca]
MLQRSRRRTAFGAALVALFTFVSGLVVTSPARAATATFLCDDGGTAGTETPSYSPNSQCASWADYYLHLWPERCLTDTRDEPLNSPQDTMNVSCIDSAVPNPPGYGSSADVSFMLDVVNPGLAGPGVLNGGTYRVDGYVRNLSTTTTAQQVRVPLTLNGLTVISATPTAGTFSGTTWTVGNLAPGVERRIVLQVKTPIGTGLKATNLVAQASASTTDPASANNRKVETLISSSGPFAKTDGGCTSGSLQSRNRTSTVNPNGYRADGWRIFRTGVVRATMTWTGVCMASDGRLLTTGTYNVTAAGINGWTLVSVGAAQCTRDQNVAHCNRYVELQAPQGWRPETLELAGSIGTTLNAGITQAAANLGITLNPQVSFQAVWNAERRTIRLPFSMLMYRGGCTWAAGAGSSSLPGSCG